jgi:hypothetical protein
MHITFRMHRQHIFRTGHFLTTKQCQFPVCAEKNSHNPQRKNRIRIPSEKDALLLKVAYFSKTKFLFQSNCINWKTNNLQKPMSLPIQFVIQRITQNHKIRNTKSGKLSSTSRTQRIITFFGPF